MGVSFFTPVKWDDGSSVIQLKQTCFQKVVQVAESYLYLGGHVAVIMPNSVRDGSYLVTLKEHKTNVWLSALKVASYFTVILPALALITKVIFRSNYEFQHSIAITPMPSTPSPIVTPDDDSPNQIVFLDSPIAKAPLTLVRSPEQTSLKISTLDNQKNSPNNLSLDFQNSVKQGNVDLITSLVNQGLSVNQALPNGELPLHFAVRVNEPDVALALLKLGADPEIKDFQNLSAIDHAALMKNESMLASILGYKIGKDLKEVQEQMKCKGSAAHVNELKIKIQKNSTVDVEKLTPANKAAYQGTLTALATLVPQTLNELDANGLTPIHYAILGNQSAAVEKLIQLGTNISSVTREGDTLLHFAATSGSSQILNKLISSGLDLNCKNLNGATALHYASAKENLANVELLVKAGANPHLLDNQGMSSLAMIGTSAFERDPLSLPRTQVVLFAATSLFWLFSLAETTGLITSDHAKLTAIFLAIGADSAQNWAEFSHLITNLNTKWKKVVAWISMMGLATIPPFSIGFQAWKTYYIARSAFDGLKKCWNNVGYRNWEVTRNTVVYSVNTANATYKVYKTCTKAYELCLNVPYLLKMWTALQNDDQEAYLDAYEEYLRFLRDRYNFNANEQFVDVSKCAEVEPSTLAGLSTVERLNKPELNPQCPEHALMMMSPDFTMEELREQGVALFKKTFKNMMLKEVHPDKAGSSPEIQEAAVRLNVASDTLKKWVEKNK